MPVKAEGERVAQRPQREVEQGNQEEGRHRRARVVLPPILQISPLPFDEKPQRRIG